MAGRGEQAVQKGARGVGVVVAAPPRALEESDSVSDEVGLSGRGLVAREHLPVGTAAVAESALAFAAFAANTRTTSSGSSGSNIDGMEMGIDRWASAEELLALRAATAAAAAKTSANVQRLTQHNELEAVNRAEFAEKLWGLGHHAKVSTDLELACLAVLAVLLHVLSASPRAAESSGEPRSEHCAGNHSGASLLSGGLIFQALLRVPSNAVAVTATATLPPPLAGLRSSSTSSTSKNSATETVSCTRVGVAIFPLTAMVYFCIQLLVGVITSPFPRFTARDALCR